AGPGVTFRLFVRVDFEVNLDERTPAADRHLLTELADQLFGLRIDQRARRLDRTDARSAAQQFRGGLLHAGVEGANLADLVPLVDLLDPLVTETERHLLTEPVRAAAVGLERSDPAGLGADTDLEEFVAEHVFLSQRHLGRTGLRRSVPLDDRRQPDKPA